MSRRRGLRLVLQNCSPADDQQRIAAGGPDGSGRFCSGRGPGGWERERALSNSPMRTPLASHAADDIEECALVVVAQVGQIVRKVGEVVADAGLHVLAEITIDRAQRAAPALTDIREIERS